MSSSSNQEYILAVVPKITAALGGPCACAVMYLVYSDHRQGKGNTMLRALFFVCFFEALDAMAWFLSTWAAPRNSSGFALASGTIQSCEFQGFWLQFVIGAPLSNCALAYYFYMIVVMGQTPEQVSRMECRLQGTIILYALVTSFLLLGLGQYNHIAAVCWVNGSPPGCDNSVFKANPNVPCERGNWAWVYGMVLFYIPLWICILLIISFNLSISRRLGQAEAKWFGTQSVLYGLAFIVTWAPSTIWSAMHWKAGGGGGLFGLDLAAAICEPLAGFWNLLIFIRNRPRLRRKVKAFLCCQTYQEPPPRQSSRASAASQNISQKLSERDLPPEKAHTASFVSRKSSAHNSSGGLEHEYDAGAPSPPAAPVMSEEDYNHYYGEEEMMEGEGGGGEERDLRKSTKSTRSTKSSQSSSIVLEAIDAENNVASMPVTQEEPDSSISEDDDDKKGRRRQQATVTDDDDSEAAARMKTSFDDDSDSGGGAAANAAAQIEPTPTPEGGAMIDDATQQQSAEEVADVDDDDDHHHHHPRQQQQQQKATTTVADQARISNPPLSLDNQVVVAVGGGGEEKVDQQQQQQPGRSSCDY